MPLPIAVGIGAVLVATVVPLVVKVALAFGIGFITYTGINLLIDQVFVLIQAQFVFPGFPQLLAFFAYINADKAITVIISAITMKATLKGMKAGGDLSRMRWN